MLLLHYQQQYHNKILQPCDTVDHHLHQYHILNGGLNGTNLNGTNLLQKATFSTNSVASNEINIAGQGKLEVQGLSQGVVHGEGQYCCKPPTNQLGGWGALYKLLQWGPVQGKASATKSLGAFWVLHVSALAVLLCKTVYNQLRFD